MKRFALLLAALTLLYASVYAEQVWPQALDIYSARNIEFSGIGLPTSTGNYLISWKDTVEPEQKQHFRLIDASGTLLWQRSFPLRFSSGTAQLLWMLESGGDFLLFFSSGNGFLHGLRLNASGENVWPETGIRLTSCNLIKPQSPSKLVSDGNGGYIHLWAWTFDGIDNPTGYFIQHMDAQGNTMISSGAGTQEFVQINNGVLAGTPDLFLMPDGGMICAYRENNLINIRRMAPNHSFTWTRQIIDTEPVWPTLIDTGDGCFNLIWHTSQGIKAIRCDYNFNDQWTMELELCQTTAGMTAKSRKSVLCADGKSVTLWQSGTQLMMQRFSNSGTLECGSNGALVMDPLPLNAEFELLPDETGGCFVRVSDAATGQIWGQYVSAENHILAQAVNLNQSLPNTMIGNGLSSALFPSGMRCYYQASLPGSSSISFQGMNSTGTTSYPNTPPDIVSGSCGRASSPLAVGSDGKVFCTWLDDPGYPVISSDLRQINYQWVHPDGTALLSVPGKLFLPNAQRPVIELQAVSTNTGSVLICWVEDTSPRVLKAQLIDPLGNQVWEPGGMIICDSVLQSVSQNSYMRLSIAHDATYIVWVQNEGGTATSIRAQKIVSNQIVWQDGGMALYSANSSSLKLIALDQDYFIYGSASSNNYIYPSVRISRFTADGTLMNGFADTHLGYDLAGISCKAGTDRVFTAYSTAEWEIEWFNFYPHGQAFSATGERLWGDGGISGFWGSNMFTHENKLYLTRPSNVTSIHGFNLDGQQLFSFTMPSDPSGAIHVVAYQIEKSLGNRFVGLAQNSPIYWGTNLYYYCFDSTGWNTLDSDFLLASGAPIRNPSLCRQNSDVYAIWGTSATFTDTAISSIRLQRINAHLVDNDDPLAPLSQLPKLDFANPNPFSVKVCFDATLPQKGRAEIGIYNLRGQLVRRIFTGTLESGKNAFEWDGLDDAGRSTANGVYICKAHLNGTPHSIKMVKLR